MELLIVGLCIFIIVFMIVANWKIFVKMNEAGWKSLIPVYSTYVRFNRLWNRKAAITVLVSNLAIFVIYLMMGVAMIREAQTMGSAGLSDEFMMKLFMAEAPLLIAILISVSFGMIVANKQAEAFGKGVGTALGLIFFPMIFVPILAFGSAEYKDAQAEPMKLPEASGFGEGF